MSGYTPSDDEVKECYAFMRDRHMFSPTIEKAREFRESGGGIGEIERWLAEHDAKVRAEERERVATALREKFGVTNRAASWIEREAGLK